MANLREGGAPGAPKGPPTRAPRAPARPAPPRASARRSGSAPPDSSHRARPLFYFGRRARARRHAPASTACRRATARVSARAGGRRRCGSGEARARLRVQPRRRPAPGERQRAAAVGAGRRTVGRRWGADDPSGTRRVQLVRGRDETCPLSTRGVGCMQHQELHDVQCAAARACRMLRARAPARTAARLDQAGRHRALKHHPAASLVEGPSGVRAWGCRLTS